MKAGQRRRALVAGVAAFALIAAACGDDDSESSSDTEATDSDATTEDTAAETTATTEESTAGTEEGTEGSTDPIVIGFPTASTEFLSFYDGPILESAQLAADDINANGGLLGGRMIEITHADNQSDIALVESRAIELLDAGADIIHTSCDFDFGSPAARAATERGVFALGCASAPEYGFEGLGELVFNTFPADVTESAVMAQFTIDQGWEQAVLFQDQSLEATITVCDTFAEVYEELGGTVVGVETFEGADFSLAPQLASVRDSDAQAIVLCTTNSAAVKQIRDETDLPIVSQVALEGTFWLDCCPGLSDFYAVGLASVAGDDPDPERAAFIESYTEATGAPPLLSIVMAGYAAVEALAIAIEEAGSVDGAAIAEAMSGFDNVELVTGATSYSPTCHIPIGRDMVMIQVQDGEYSFAAEVEPTFLPESIC